MLALAILQLLGLIALGLLVTPFLFCLMGITVSVIVLIVNILIRLMRQQSLKGFPKVFKKFLWFSDSIMHHSENSEYKIYPPNYTHSIRVSSENGRYIQPVSNLEGKSYYEDDVNKYHLDMPDEPVATKLEQMLNIFHKTILFYRSYYGHSTKVEKNQIVYCFQMVE